MIPPWNWNGWCQDSHGHDLLIPESQSQPQHIYYYYCYLITPATTTTLITAAISYLLLLMLLLLHFRFSYKYCCYWFCYLYLIVTAIILPISGHVLLIVHIRHYSQINSWLLWCVGTSLHPIHNVNHFTPSALLVHHMFTTIPSRVEMKPDHINVDCRLHVQFCS